MLKIKNQKKSTQTYPCLNVYPKDKGGIKYEDMSSVDPMADLWLKAETGKYYYLQYWNGKELVAFQPLPEVIEIGADYIARMLSCPYIKLKSLKVGLWAKLQGWIPFAVLGIAIFCWIIFGGE